LNDLELVLNKEKTLITNARYEKASFLGVRFGLSKHRTYNKFRGYLSRNKFNIRFEVPLELIKKKLTNTNFLKGIKSQPKLL